jgi:hypothetical protein
MREVDKKTNLGEGNVVRGDHMSCESRTRQKDQQDQKRRLSAFYQDLSEC